MMHFKQILGEFGPQKGNVIFQPSIFRGKLLVSERVLQKNNGEQTAGSVVRM